MKKLFCLILALFLLLPALPRGEAYTRGEPFSIDLSARIRDKDYRDYVEMMLDYHLRNNELVQDVLSGGYSAVFLFDGCSDNMNDPALSDLSYYRVSGVCIVLKQLPDGEVRLQYFSDNCSTIPDRPLEYGAWRLPEVGDVGPATVCDGTYQLYSVRHKGEYEAFHVRTEYTDGTLEAVYMIPDGYVSSRANEINVHTRTSNHTSGRGMWSAGCPLVGGGERWEFERLLDVTYYTNYETFELDSFIGCLTIDRQQLREELYTLYKNPNAVDRFLTNSRNIQPEMYLRQCTEKVDWEEPEPRKTVKETTLMNLPCTNYSDARSFEIQTIPAGEILEVLGSVVNDQGNLWYRVAWEEAEGYLYMAHVQELTFREKLAYYLWK